MAKPVDFAESNFNLLPAQGDEGRVGELRAYRDLRPEQPQLVSCWELSDEEIIQIINTKRVWVYVLGMRHPPIYVGGTQPHFPEKPADPAA